MIEGTLRDESPEAIDERPTGGWKRHLKRPTLSEVFRTIHIPENAGLWRHLLAFFGPGYLVAVGYMDPGNWATDIGGGSLFGYRLLSVVLVSNFLAIFLQALAAKLGIITGRDLAQACRDAYAKPIAVALWISAEIAIIACDIAEVIGAAIALNLLFHIPLIIGVVITALDVLLVLALQHKGFRWIETIVISLIAAMMAIFAVELIYARPDWLGVAAGFLPKQDIIRNPQMLYLSLGILGATVMPHNLYLHSSIVQTRKHGYSTQELKKSVQSAYADSTIALMLALFVNAAILILAAAAFHNSGHRDVADIQSAYKLLTPLLGATLAAPLFAIALLASGQNSTLTGTMAGQVILEGFTDFQIPAWMRRMISRCIAIVPSIFVIALYGEKGINSLIIFSQVILSAQLSFAVIPLMQLTGDKEKLGAFVNGSFTKAIGWTIAVAIAGLNGYLICITITR